jgi:hypothetical protein
LQPHFYTGQIYKSYLIFQKNPIFLEVQSFVLFFEAIPAFPPSPLFHERFLRALRLASVGRRRKTLKNRRSKCVLSVQSGLRTNRSAIFYL